VTNTLSVDFLTGLQRLTHEILTRLPGPDADGPVRCVPIRWCRSIDDFRRLTPAESARLHDPAPPRPPEVAASPPGGAAASARRAASRLAAVGPVRQLRHEVQRRRDPAGSLAELRSLRTDLEPGSVLFDLEACWEDPARRGELLPRLARQGVGTAALIADVMPVMFPQWFRPGTVERFTPFVEAHLRSSDAFAWISRRTEADCRDLARSLGVGRDLGGRVVTLGSDLPASGSERPPADLVGRRYLLCVATLEPRKNQALVLDVLDRLRGRHPDLVVVLVGRHGWGVDDLVARIDGHPARGDAVRWLGSVSDDELATLYRHAFLAVVPSRYEGFGVPVIEALAHGTPTISSDGGALPEAGGDLVEYAGPDDVDRWAALVDRHLSDPAHHDAARRRITGYSAPTWRATAAAVTDLLVEVAEGSRR
jgi:glycosyltransferase involved in cell wall biosynthesis